jgi:hypothetical protein
MKAESIWVKGRRYVYAGALAKRCGYELSGLHHLQKRNAIPAIIQGKRKYICESALRTFLKERPPSQAKQVANWLKDHPRAKWKHGMELAALMAKDGIQIIPHDVARLLRQIGKARDCGALAKAAMLWMEADPLRRFWPGKARRAGLEAALNRPVSMAFVRRVQRHYDKKHGCPSADYPAADWIHLAEAARQCKVKRETVQYWIDHGFIQAEQRLTRWYIQRASLASFLDKRANHVTKTAQVRAYLREHSGESLADVARRFGCDDGLVARVKKALKAEA